MTTGSSLCWLLLPGEPSGAYASNTIPIQEERSPIHAQVASYLFVCSIGVVCVVGNKYDIPLCELREINRAISLQIFSTTSSVMNNIT